MAVTDQQKLDFLLKKIGYTKTKTGSVVGTGAISGTPKQPFAEAIPSPLIIANGALWNEADSIPTTPPGADTNQVKVYLAATSGLRMTADATSSGQRAYIAYSTYGNTSSTRLTNWIDTQFGASYIIKVYRGDPNSGGVNLSAAGSGANDGWFFDYSAGVLNFNDTNVPSGVTDTNIYIVGYRYIGQTGAPTSGISTFSYLDLTVERNLDVGIQGGISTFRNNIDLNANLDVSGSSTFTGNIDVDGHTNLDNVSVVGVTTFSEDVITGVGATVGIGTDVFFGDNVKATFGDSGDLEIGHIGDQNIIEDKGNGALILRTNGSSISLQRNTGATMLSAVPEQDVRLYYNGSQKFATSGIGASVYGTIVATGADINGDLDVDGHTNLDNVSIAGVTTTSGLLDINAGGQANTFKVEDLTSGRVVLAGTGGELEDSANLTFNGSNLTVGGNVNAVDGVFSGNVSIGGTLTYEDVTNVDSVGLLTARSGIRVTGGVIEAQAGENKIPSLYSNLGALPSAGTYHGMFAHVHSTGRGYFAHAGNWLELVNKETNGTVGTGTETYNIGSLTATAIDLNGDIDVDGHTELDNVNIVGVATVTGEINIPDRSGNSNWITFGDGEDFKLWHSGTSSHINNITGDLYIQGSSTNGAKVVVSPAGGAHGELARFQTGDGVRLFYDGGILRLLTRADGVRTYGTLEAANLNVTGVTTAVTVDINGDLDVDGHTNLDNSSISGITTIALNQELVFGSNADSQLTGRIKQLSGSSPSMQITSRYPRINALDFRIHNINNNQHYAYFWSSEVALFHQGNKKFSTTGGGINVTGNVVSDGLVVDGNSDLNGDLDVDGHTNLDNVSVAGVTTFSNTVHVGTGTTIESNGQATFTGITTFHKNIKLPNASGGDTTVGRIQLGDGPAIMELYHYNNNNYFTFTANQFIRGDAHGRTIHIQPKISQNGIEVIPNGAVELYYSGTKRLETTAQGIEVTGHSELDNVNIVGVTTHQGHILPSADVTYDLGSSSKQWRNLYADNIVSAPGNGFTGPDLTVRNLKATGLSTFVGQSEFDGNVKFDSTITAGGSTGTNGQYLKSTGSGVAWASFPTLRTRQTFTASAGQTTFSFSYNVNFVDVFVNGIKLTDAEFTATNGSSVVLAVGCFVGDIVELVSYNTVSGGGGGGGGGTLNNIVEDTTPQLGGNLDLFNKNITGTGNINITGSVTATNFIGNGSGLTGIVASGSGVVIKNSGSTVGTAGTINFGDNLSVSPASAGIVTITAAGISTNNGVVSIANDLDVDGHTNLDNVNIVGVTTVNGNIDLSTGSDPFIKMKNIHNRSKYYVWSSPQYAIGADQSSYGGLETNTEAMTFQMPNIDNGGWLFLDSAHSSSGGVMALTTLGEMTVAHSLRLGYGTGDTTTPGATDRLDVNGSIKATGADINGDLDVDGHTNLDNVSIAGVVTATTLKGALQGTSGTFSSGVDITGDLDVDGHTDLDNVSIAGVVTATTFVGALTGNVTGNVSGSSGSCTGNSATATEATNVTVTANNSTNETVYPVFVDGATGTQGAETDTGLNYNPSTGNLSATKFTGDGSGLTGITASGSGIVVKHDGSTVGTAGTINFGTNLDVSAISGGAVTITGISSFTAQSASQRNTFSSNSASALTSNSQYNTIIGWNAGNTISTGDENTIYGFRAGGVSNTSQETIIGYNCFSERSGHTKAVGLGWEAGKWNQSDSCTAIGYEAVRSASGNNNTGLGYQALRSVSTGTNNVGLGYQAGNTGTNDLTEGSNNIIIGYQAAASSATVSNEITLGNSSITKLRVPGINVVLKDNGGTPTQGHVLTVDANGEAGFAAASGGGGSGISTISGVVNIANDLDVDGHTNLDNVSIAGVTTFANDVKFDGSSASIYANWDQSGNALFFRDNSHVKFGNNNGMELTHSGGAAGNGNINNRQGGLVIRTIGSDAGDIFIDSKDDIQIRTHDTVNAIVATGGGSVDLYYSGSKKIETTNTGVTVTGTLAATAVTGDGSGLTGISANVGITTNLSGTFTASAGSPSTINTFAYHDNDKVVEYTVYIKNGSNFQSQKVLAMRDGTTIHSTQFAVMFSSSLIVQCDATISSGNILLRATPETGVSGSTTYKVKREVM